MRAFGVVSPQFWTGRTGKEIQAAGPEAVILAMYLMTSPHSHMCGLYYLPKPYIKIDTGRPLRAIDIALKQLANLPSGGFAYYDEESQHVWIPEMLRWQVGTLKPSDSRVQAIAKWYQGLPKIPFVHAFYDRYSAELPSLEKLQFIAPKTGGAGGVETPKRPPSLSLSPDPVPVLEGGPGETKKPYGEFGHAQLTDSEHAKLKAEMNGHLDDYIRQFDVWVHENPHAKKDGMRRIDRNPYLSIGSWYRRAVLKGEVQARAPASGDDLAEIDRIRKKTFGKLAK